MDILIIIVLIVAAVILFLVELFVIPGISIAGILAGACMIYANYYAFAYLGYNGWFHHARCIGNSLHRLIDTLHALQDLG